MWSQKQQYCGSSSCEGWEDSRILTNFTRCTTESILSCFITTWYGSCNTLDWKALQRVVWLAQRLTRTELPAIQKLYRQRWRRKTSQPQILHAPAIRQAVQEHREPYQRVQEQFLSAGHQATELLNTIQFTLNTHSSKYWTPTLNCVTPHSL